MIKEERCGTLARRRRKRVTSRGEKDAFARGGLTSDEQGRGARDRDSEEERDAKREVKKEEERSEVKGYAERRKERGRREASGTRRSRGGLRQDAVPSRYTSLRT